MRLSRPLIFLLCLGAALKPVWAEDDQAALKAKAEHGDAHAQYHLGENYYKARNLDEGARWMRKAADQGDPEAQVFLGMTFWGGLGVQRNKELAFQWVQRAADQNYAPGQEALGGLYLGEKDYANCMLWMLKAAAQSNVLAEVNLGKIYENGFGVEKDRAQASSWYRKAAEQGDPEAEDQIGVLLMEDTTPDPDQAVTWFRKSAQQGYAKGEFDLGQLYAIGKGVAKNDELAVMWFRKAAEQGNAGAFLDLGISYANGRGVEKNLVLAYAYTDISAGRGGEKAPERRAAYEQKLSPAELEQARKLSASWAPNKPLPGMAQ